MMTTTNPRHGQIAHEMLASDVALLYRWGVTPEGEGVRLDRTDDGWTDSDAGRTYAAIQDAYPDADAALTTDAPSNPE